MKSVTSKKLLKLKGHHAVSNRRTLDLKPSVILMSFCGRNFNQDIWHDFYKFSNSSKNEVHPSVILVYPILLGVIVALVTEKNVQIGLNVAEIGFLVRHTYRNCDRVRFHSLVIHFLWREVNEINYQLPLKMTSSIGNDSDSFITLTIM